MNDRKQQVLLTAKQIFVEKGFSATSVQDILDEAKISKGTFYNYFTSKNECLKAILDNGRDETLARRQELLIGKSKKNKSILATQISIRFQVNREHNLLPILEAVFFSDDLDLRNFAKNHHLSELSWLTARLIDVYGDKAKPFALDCAASMTGMMQHMIHVWTACSKEDIDTLKLVTFVMNRIDSILLDMIKKDDRFFDSNTLVTLEGHLEKNPCTKQQLVLQLTEFHDRLEGEMKPANEQYILFLIDEIKSEQPRIFLLETVIRAFRSAYIDTSLEEKAHGLAARVWKYAETLKKTT